MNHDYHVCKDKIWRRQNTCIVNIQNVGKPEIVICFVSALMDWWALRLPNYDGRKKEKSKTFWCELNFKVKETQMFLSMIQVLQSWNAANVQHYRLDGGNVTNPRFLFFSQCGFNHCCVVRYYNVTQKNIFDFASRNHMQRAAARLSQQHCAAAKKLNLFAFFLLPLLLCRRFTTRQKRTDCVSRGAIRERCNCKQLRRITNG